MGRCITFGFVACLGLGACSRAEVQPDTDARASNGDGGGSSALDDAGDNGATDGAVDAPVSLTCGDGALDTGEACDDSNTSSNDGCSSACALEPTQTVSVTALNLSLVDDGYNGTLASMTCASVVVAPWYTPAIASMTVTVGMSHGWVGDLVIKAVAPDDTVVTLVSRPGYAEPADDGTGTLGNSADLVVGSPITFMTGATTSAEAMGNSINTVCFSDNVCTFAPNNGAAAAGTLTAFDGKPSTGTWKLCAGDSNALDTGKLDRVTLTFNH